MEPGIYLRRDTADNLSFFIEIVGTKSEKSAILQCVLIDAIYDLWGNEVGDWAKSFAPGHRKKIELTLKEA